MDYSEKWGRDVDEAVRLALDDLGLTEDQVMVTVLEEPTKGFLGLGQKLAKVRVEKVQFDDIDDEEDKRHDQRKVTHDLRKKNKQNAGGAQSSGYNSRPDRRDRFDGDRGAPHKRNDRSDRGNNKYESIPEYDFSDKPSLAEKPDNLVQVEENEASQFLLTMINKMNLSAEIAVFENDECVYIEVSGEDSKTVIGKRGQTLDAIQYLTNLVANKNREVYRRVIVDVEGYRSRREKTLERLAVKLAQKVLKSGRSVRLEPMNPYERKVIHSTLQKIDGVDTRSEGEEPYRRVIIDRVK